MPSVKAGVTVRPPDTARCRVTVKVTGSPSAAPASETVTVALPPVPPLSSSAMVPVAGSPVVTPSGALETVRPTVNVSSCSITSSW